MRVPVAEFGIIQKTLAGASVAIYESDEYGRSTGVLATLYQAETGPEIRRNPQVLNQNGMFEAPVWVEDTTVIAAISNISETTERALRKIKVNPLQYPLPVTSAQLAGEAATVIIPNIDEIIAVANNIEAVVRVDGNESNITIVATDIDGDNNIKIIADDFRGDKYIEKVGQNIDAVAGVHANKANIDIVAADLNGANNIGTVAGEIENVKAVGENMPAVLNLDSNMTEINGLYARRDEIDALYTDLFKLVAVYNSLGPINGVYDDLATITAVNNNKANIDLVASKIDEIEAAPAAADAAAQSAIQAAQQAQALVGTSTSSVSIGTGTKTFTINEPLRQWLNGQYIVITDQANPNDNVMYGRITDYDTETDRADIEFNYFAGSGNIENWNLQISGIRGPQGPAGNLADGDYGDITVSGDGSAMAINAGVITDTDVASLAGIDVTKIGDGTVTNTEFKYLDGTTSNIQTQINGKQATVTGAATSIVSSNLTASRALISDASGKVGASSVTSTELGYLSGVSSSIQTQLNGKLSNSNSAVQTANIGDLQVTNTKLAAMDAYSFMGNHLGTPSSPSYLTPAQAWDVLVPSAEQGDVIIRDGTGFTRLAAGTDGQVLTTKGAGQDPAWETLSGLPVGTTIEYNGSTAPDGFLEENGAEVSRTTYAALFDVIGTTFGAGDGVTTFNLPNRSRRVAVGRGGTGTGVLGNAIGNTGGAETHTLSAGELASHSHGAGSLTAASAGAHQHPVPPSTSSGGGGVTYPVFNTNGNGNTPTMTGSAGAHTHPISGNTANAGSGQAHNNMQPSIVKMFCIKY